MNRYFEERVATITKSLTVSNFVFLTHSGCFLVAGDNRPIFVSYFYRGTFREKALMSHRGSS